MFCSHKLFASKLIRQPRPLKLKRWTSVLVCFDAFKYHLLLVQSQVHYVTRHQERHHRQKKQPAYDRYRHKEHEGKLGIPCKRLSDDGKCQVRSDPKQSIGCEDMKLSSSLVKMAMSWF